jgi:hypothetical protein
MGDVDPDYIISNIFYRIGGRYLRKVGWAEETARILVFLDE